jgi:hypothetical protein
MKLALLLSSLLIASGCAHYDIDAIGSAGYQSGHEGYVCYEPDPYLAVLPMIDKDGKPTDQMNIQLVWLPNYDRAYRVTSTAGLSKADFAFTFQNGWMLTAVNDKADNSAFGSKGLDFILNAAKSGISFMSAGAEKKPMFIPVFVDKQGGGRVLNPILKP